MKEIINHIKRSKRSIKKYSLLFFSTLGISGIVVGSVISCTNSNSDNVNKDSNPTLNDQITINTPTTTTDLIDSNTNSLTIQATFTSNFSLDASQFSWLINDYELQNVTSKSTNPSDFNFTSTLSGNTLTLVINATGLKNIAQYYKLSNGGSFTISVYQSGYLATKSASLTINYFTYNLTNVPKNTNSDIKTIKQANNDWTNKWNTYSSALQQNLLTQNFDNKFSQILTAHNEDFNTPKAFTNDTNSAIYGWTYTKAISINTNNTSITYMPTLSTNNKEVYDIQIEISTVYSSSHWKDFATVNETLDITDATFTPSVVNGSNYGMSGYFGGLVLSSYSSATLNVNTVYTSNILGITKFQAIVIKNAMDNIAPNYSNYTIKEGSSLSTELMQNADIIIGNLNGIDYGNLSN